MSYKSHKIIKRVQCGVIYGPANSAFKNEFWCDLITYCNSLSIPFVVMGDYNEIGKPCDKLGGASTFYRRVDRLLNFTSLVPCKELPSKGFPFTWRKKTHGPDNIHEKLDHGYASIEW